MKRALITGVNGQDGAYLASYLLSQGYYVFGLIRPTSISRLDRLESIISHSYFKLCYSDMTDCTRLAHILKEIQPDEVYNLAAQSHVGISFDMPAYTAHVDGIGVLYLLEAIRITGLTHAVRLYQASSSELFGKVYENPQKETTPFYPRSPYAVAKLYAYWMIKNYRESYGVFASNGILFNHESPLRGEEFVTRKITKAAAAFSMGIKDPLRLGNLNAQRDWGHAKDYVRAMVLMMQHHQPDDFVIATGKTHSIRYCVEQAFAAIGISIIWMGSGVNERGIDATTGKECVVVDPQFFRPCEVDTLCGDSTKARTVLGWMPQISFEEMIVEMVNYDCNELRKKHTNEAMQKDYHEAKNSGDINFFNHDV